MNLLDSSMSESTDNRTLKNTDRLLRGGKRPVLAIVSFLAAFLFAALPFAINSDRFLIVAPCVIACVSCSILFMRLLIGKLGIVNWLLLGVAGYLCIVAEREWHVVVLLTGGTVVSLFVIDRLIGTFVPLINVSEQRGV